MRDHANAKAPWTCQCECHKRKPENSMPENDVREEEFETEVEALAFICGLNYCDNDHVSNEPPYQRGHQWVVEVREFA